MREFRSLSQLRILLYKGFLLRKRHYFVTFFEIGFPILITSIIAIIVSSACAYIPTGSHESVWVNATTYEPLDPYKKSSSWNNPLELVYVNTQSSPVIEQLMSDAIKKFSNNTNYNHISKKSFPSESALESYINFVLRNQTYSTTVIGTVFNNFNSKTQLPDSLDYKIRVGVTYSLFNLNSKYRFDGPNHYSIYYDSYFLSWQAAVEQTFIEKKGAEKGKDVKFKVQMQRFPYPEHMEINFTYTAIIPSLIFYGYIGFIINLLRRVIEEKSNGSKELFKIMGMTDNVYWTSTFLNYFIIAAFTALIICIIYKSPLKTVCMVLIHTDFLLLYIGLLFFLTMLILFCMIFTVFFNKAVIALVVMIVIVNISLQLLSVYVFPITSPGVMYLPLPTIAKFCICLLPHGALLSLFYFISFYESVGKGLTWSSLTEFSVSPDFNVLMVFGSMLFGCFLYMVMIWYFDKIWPWQNGVPQPYYFLFTKKYWFGDSFSKVDEMQLINPSENSSDYFEAEPAGISAGIAIRNLSKEFQAKAAVKNVSLNIYEGQITALLGHNGAGKTTTINILTGLYPPTSGTAFINGSNVVTDSVKSRRGIGVCPQHNVLFDTLTVEEHLKIYASLKGVPWRELTSEASKILDLLRLQDKRNELIKNTSGGMKRKLSLGIAMIGGSKVLFLDEPTSGLDVEARRSIWDTLRDIRHDKTIILTTHYMEEADILGDRIAIMAEGEVQCCGAPIYLKQKFGTGYHLHVVKDEHFNRNDLLMLLKRFVPNVEVGNEIGKEIAFSLDNTDTNFGDMFEELEKNKQHLGVMSYGITITTMEDVFLKVSSLSDMKYKTKEENQLNANNGVAANIENVFGASTRIVRQQDILSIIKALLIKRLQYTKRHWNMLLVQLIMPILLLIALFSVLKAISSQSQSESLKLDIGQVYGKTTGFYSSSDSNPPKMTDIFRKDLEKNYVQVQNLKNPTQYILDFGKRDLARYLQYFLVGGAIYEQSNDVLNLTAWYNGEPYHIQPMSLLLMHDALLKYVTDSSASISLTNSPIQMRQYYGFEASVAISSILSAVFIPMGMVFLSAPFVMLPTHERVSKAKLLQLMSGLHSVTYWVSMFIWDYMVHFVATLVLLIPFASFGYHVFFSHNSQSIGAALLLLWLYGWAAIPFSYLFSLPFKKGNTGYSVVVVIGMVFGTAAVSILASLQLLTTVSIKEVNPFIWIFRFLPIFSVGAGFSNLFFISYNNAYCDNIPAEDLTIACNSPSSYNPLFRCCKDICGSQCLKQYSPLTMDRIGCGSDLLFLALDGFIYFGLLILLETQLMAQFGRLVKHQIMQLRKSVTGQVIQQSQVEDADVIAEADRVRYMQVQRPTDALVAVDMTKIFRNFFAVDHVTFGIHPEECFGLLGVNGAGKTTTFRMITGDCYPTDGNAFIKGFSLRSDLRMFQSHLGYCPQFDALIDRLTGREMLSLFGRLRGLSGAPLDDQVNKLINMTDLEAHADKQTRFYSGGNKRKLSVGIALVGSPQLILLDEPTAGVDPVSRRKIWNVLSQARNNMGSAVLLTTHSMEESEALCSRLAIMVNGQFKCIGSIQQLKSKYGQGYTLIVKIKRENQENFEFVNQVKEHIKTHLYGADLKDDHQGLLQYHIINKSITLSYLFKFMAVMKNQFQLEDYLISDTSLEQIFLTFARAQRISA